MKTLKKLYYFALLIGWVSFAQVNVTTITPEIKGSGGLSLDSDGGLMIADFGDFLSVTDPDGLPNDILKMDTNFNLSQYATGFVGASGNDFESNGILYQSDIRASGIYKIINGTRTFVTSNGISAPVGLVFDSDDNFFVCNCGDDTIRKVTPAGVSTLFASGTLFKCPNGITIDEEDNLYVSNFNNGNVIKIDTQGNASVLNTTPGGTTGGASNGHVEYHQPSRTLFIASHGSNKIYYLNIDNPSNLQVLAGSGVRGNIDGPAASASFSRPNGLAVTQTGDSLYVNSAIPVTNIPNGPLNPQVIRLITGIQSVLALSDNEPLIYDFKTYPNPVKNEFTIEANFGSEFNNLQIEIFDIQGRTIKKIQPFTDENGLLKAIVNLSEYASGIYFLSVYNKKNRLLNRKIIKE